MFPPLHKTTGYFTGSSSLSLPGIETFEKRRKIVSLVIPAKAGIQYFHPFPGFRVKPGMTEKGSFPR
jgi:hypothetical protein